MRTIAAVSNVTIGLFAANSHALAEPKAALRIARLAEQLGYDSLWAGEHVVVPSPRVDPSPMEPDEEDRLDMAEGLTIHSRLGCQAVVRGDVTVEVPS